MKNRRVMRGFEVVSNIKGGVLPIRSTKASAGYDISVIDGAVIEPGGIKVFSTGIKAYMEVDEYLALHVRSSIGIKRGVMLANVTGIIDSDYYNNSDNEGHIMVALLNTTSKPVTIESGERVCQGIFSKYLVTDEDCSTNLREGGIGSTN